MTVAYWCVVVVMFFPWAMAYYGKHKAGFTGEDNHNAREFFAKVTGAAARANAAQLNSYEIFPAFAAAVIIAHLSTQAAQSTINVWAILFVISRAAYCYCYIADKPTIRSLFWVVGLICILALFIAAI